MSLFLQVLRSLWRDARRTGSSLLITSCGLLALLLGQGFMLSTYDALQEMAMRSQGHLSLLPAEGQEAVDNWQAIQQEWLADARVLRILPRLHLEGMLSHGPYSAAFWGEGVDPRQEFRVHGPFLQTTEVLDPWRDASSLPEVLLGSTLAKRLHARPGTVLALDSRDGQGRPVHVQVQLAGTLHTGEIETDAHRAMFALAVVAEWMHSPAVSRLSVYLHQSQGSRALQRIWQQRYPAYRVVRWDQQAALHDKVKQQYDRIFGVMGGIILLVVFLAVSNTMALTLYQRRAELATLSALGCPRLRLTGQVVLEAALMGGLAVLLAMLGANLLAHAVNAAGFSMPAPPGRSEGYPIFIAISWSHYTAISAGLWFVVVLAALWAVLRHLKINLAQALSG